ncbi:MAG: DUF3124 domain-containing protein [Bacteroidales bacterium]|nr:DUF3124 domain-containing protein [Bacteroidales bacterium]
MKNIIKIVFILLLFLSCKTEVDHKIVKSIDLDGRKLEISNFDDLIHGKSYLSVYSHIYHRYEDKAFDLTITVSIRNISATDSIYILKADYFNTDGVNIRQYIQDPICLKPLETVEIVIAEEDEEGGSGANFVFDWAVKNEKNPPLFEAVMISTNGQQGLSFTTRGVQVFE